MLKIFNTLNRKKEFFSNIYCNIVNIYVCGVTISNFCHIGHGRTYCFYDILVRYLNYLGYKCNYVRNITDINDDICKKVISNDINLNKLSLFMIESMFSDFSKLNLIIPDNEPKVTDHIDLIIYYILKLIKCNYAYISVNGDVLFSVKKNIILNNIFFKNINYKFNDKCDFVLWKLNKNNKIYGWNSPWGIGRPGWHIECSVISNKYLPSGIDIHGGGIDLIFPHHANEFIQSKCLFGNDFKVKYWVHTGLVLFNGNKMSKSKNNFFLLSNLLNLYNSDVIRYYLMSVHYRKNLFFDNCILNKYKLSLIRLYLCLNDLNLNVCLSKKDLISLRCFDDKFNELMDDDFNIPGVYKLFNYMSNEINKLKNKKYNLASKIGVRMRFLAKIIGLLNFDVNFFLKKSVYNDNIKLIEKINKLIKIRNIFRKLKNWKQSDLIRKELLSLNVNVNDKVNGSTDWYFF